MISCIHHGEGVKVDDQLGTVTCSTCVPLTIDLKTVFDRVILISLKKRHDRRVKFCEQLVKKGWPFQQPQLFDAVDGSIVPSPVGWQAGGGTWGCLASHRRVLEQAIMDDVKSILVLEDDAYPVDDFERCAEFFAAVPEDWQMLMLGGQHIRRPDRVDKGVVQCLNTQRTHAYAVRGQMLRDLYALWSSGRSVTHADHILGTFQQNYIVYAPDPFLFGQAEGKSDISGQHQPSRSWDLT